MTGGYQELLDRISTVVGAICSLTASFEFVQPSPPVLLNETSPAPSAALLFPPPPTANPSASPSGCVSIPAAERGTPLYEACKADWTKCIRNFRNARECSRTFRCCVRSLASPCNLCSGQRVAYATSSPTASPTAAPSASPSEMPTSEPTVTPTEKPTAEPSATPTNLLTDDKKTNAALPINLTFAPIASGDSPPKQVPFELTTDVPTTNQPTVVPSTTPTEEPTAEPTETPTEAPSSAPSVPPTDSPTQPGAERKSKCYSVPAAERDTPLYKSCHSNWKSCIRAFRNTRGCSHTFRCCVRGLASPCNLCKSKHTALSSGAASHKVAAQPKAVAASARKAGGCMGDSAGKGALAGGDFFMCPWGANGYIYEAHKAACSTGYHVCNGKDMWSSGIGYSQATSVPGCYAYDAANDCDGCFTTCKAAASVNGKGGCYDPKTPDMPGIGAGCHYQTRGRSECLKGGGMVRADDGSRKCYARKSRGITGVLCCKN